ncbi:hypothetical protein [Bosea sp. LC85]|uniref:hypothetical protein n=1 Tax=Bosea sp. LC85 TaxID=1502851 RepID=UPI0005BBA55C|nr:hypothetical protein [Bosea sp. LC85]
MDVRSIEVAQMTVITQSEGRSGRRLMVAVEGITCASSLDRVEQARRLRHFLPPMTDVAVAPLGPQQVSAQ